MARVMTRLTRAIAVAYTKYDAGEDLKQNIDLKEHGHLKEAFLPMGYILNSHDSICLKERLIEVKHITYVC